jgi:hypothetical protein
MIKGSVPGGHKEMSSILTNEPKCGGRGCGVSADEYISALHMEPTLEILLHI